MNLATSWLWQGKGHSLKTRHCSRMNNSNTKWWLVFLVRFECIMRYSLIILHRNLYVIFFYFLWVIDILDILYPSTLVHTSCSMPLLYYNYGKVHLFVFINFRCTIYAGTICMEIIIIFLGKLLPQDFPSHMFFRAIKIDDKLMELVCIWSALAPLAAKASTNIT